MLRYRTQGILAVGLGLFAAGCFGDPEIRTDLRSEGPPDILAAMGMSLVTAEELPLYCRYVSGVKDEKAPGFVIDAILGSQTVCPDASGDFASSDVDPRGYGVRVMFDELLDGDAVETLDCDEDGICVGTLATTQPVEIDCGGTAEDYDGYYVPNGNNTTFPLGPSLVVLPAGNIATGTSCTITMGTNVRDHQGETVPSAEADVDYRLQDLTMIATHPEDAEDVADRAVLDPSGPGAIVAFEFNAYINPATIEAADVEIRTEAGAVVASEFALDEDGDFGAVPGVAILVTGAAAFPAGNYVARLKTGAVFEEVNGGEITLTEDIDVRFVVE